MRSSVPRLNQLVWVLAVGWTLMVAASAGCDWLGLRRHGKEMARQAARLSFAKDLLYRRWVAMHGGVYVPVTPQTPPNPNLAHVPQRDLTLPSGQQLTLVNPASMTRQVQEMARQAKGVQDHITSLKPIRPENAADAWETNALRAFETGATEVSSLEPLDGQSCLRLMRPMRVESDCLKCHGDQGYRLGDIRGGISVSVPMRPYLADANAQLGAVLLNHGLIWVLGLVGLVGGGRYVRRRIQAQERTEIRLRQSEARYRGLFDHSLNGFALHEIVTDAAGQPVDYRFLEVNRAFETQTGLARPQLLGRCVTEALPDLDAAAFIETYGRVALTGEPVQFETEVPSLKRHFQIAVFSPKPGQFATVVSDITERQQAERDLRTSEEKFRALFDNAMDAIFIFDPIKGRFVEVNRTACERLQYSRDELLGMTVADIDAPAASAMIAERMEVVSRQGHHLFESTQRRRDGTVVPVEVNVRRFEHQGQTLILSVCRDLTERKQAQAELLRNEQRFRELAERLPQTVFEMNLEGRLTFVNRQAFVTFGYDPDDFTKGLEAWDMVVPAQRERARANVSRIAGGETVPPEEYTAQRKDGTTFPVMIDATAIWLDDAPGGVRGIVVDITERWQTERALRASEERLRAIFEAAPDAIFIKDLNGRYTHVNPAMEHLFARPASALLGAGDTELWEAGDAEQISAVDVRVLAGETVQGDYTRPVGGQPRSFLTVKVPLRDAQGRITGLCGLTRDITALKAVQEALQQREAELRATLNHAPVMICLLDEDLRVVQVNQAAIQFAGRPESELQGKRGGEFIGCLHVHDDPRGCGYGPECAGCPMRTAVLKTLTTGDPCQRLAVQPSVAGGRDSRLTLLMSVARIELHGRHRILLCLEDITSLKAAEEKVSWQAGLLDQTQDAVLVLDMEQRIEYANRSAERMHGQTARQLCGSAMQDVLFPEVLERILEAWETTLARGQWSGELERCLAPGKTQVVESRWVLVRGAEGQPESILIVNSDITEKKRLETQFLRAQRMESIGTLATGVAHDLNNILSPIMIAVDILRKQPSGPDDESLLNLLSGSAQRGANIVKQLLTFGRGLPGQRTELPPRPLLKEMAKVMAETFPKNIKLQPQFPDELWTIRADPTQVHQVLLNLCVNARDAMPRGGTLTLAAENLVLDEAYTRLHPELRPGPHVVVQVGDTGLGIPPELLDKVFDPFFTTKEPGQGTGLGLSTALGIVKNHEGFIQIQSRLGYGTQFRVYLPALANQAPGQTEIRPRNLPRGQGETVLLVDDEEAVRDVAQRMLEKHGYRVLPALDGADGLMTYMRHQKAIQAVVTDMLMPIMDGATLIRAIRRQAPELPMVAMSGLPAQEAEARHPTANVQAFLPKPFTTEQLLATLRQVLERPVETSTTAT